jgi:hypothetical protein
VGTLYAKRAEDAATVRVRIFRSMALLGEGVCGAGHGARPGQPMRQAREAMLMAVAIAFGVGLGVLLS